ncbi:MAG: DUF3352 domain-containing protein [Chloroflexota bacterium]
MNSFAEEERKPDHRTRNILIGGVAALVVLCGCLVVAVAGVIAIDPFGWNLLDQLFGGADRAAAVMPPDTGIFVGMDLLELTPDKIGRLVDPFLAAAGEPEAQDFDSALDQLDAAMLEEVDFDFQDDILPWLGRFGGFGVSSLVLDDYGDPEEVTWTLVLSTRDEDASEAFLLKLRDAISSESGYAFATKSYEDVTIYELDVPDTLERVAIAQANGLVLFGAGAGAIQASIDAEKGDSLADADDYRTLAGELPGNRALTFYLDLSKYAALQQELLQNVVPTDIAGFDNASAAFSLSLTDDGLQLDTVSPVDREGMNPEQEQMLDSFADESVADQLFPEGTLVYLAGQRLDLVWGSIRDSMGEFVTPEEFDESMAMFAEEFGINPDTQLFPLLDGEWAVGVLPSTAGFLAEELEVDLGLAMLAQTSDPDSLSANLASFSSALEQQALFVEHTSESDMESYSISDFPQGPSLISFGLAQGYLFVSSDAGTRGRLFGDGPSLAESDHYREVWKAFPGGMTPVFYLNAGGMVGAIREGMQPGDRADFDEVVGFMEPISALAVASDPGEETLHTTTILFITAAE